MRKGTGHTKRSRAKTSEAMQRRALESRLFRIRESNEAAPAAVDEELRKKIQARTI
jgi:hypothetical protein